MGCPTGKGGCIDFAKCFINIGFHWRRFLGYCLNLEMIIGLSKNILKFKSSFGKMTLLYERCVFDKIHTRWGMLLQNGLRISGPYRKNQGYCVYNLPI